MEKQEKQIAQTTIDATGKALGRVASAAAKALMGKTQAAYVPHNPPKVTVTITNAAKLYVTEKKRLGKVYTTYSGYPGGLKKETLSSLSTRKGYGETLRRAIQRMLPNNTHRTPRMKRLIITE